ncbi:hypothetical protein L810_6837 [Burkholderia sp. AU4i]|nr:hypothetical protein L810_6837 [Burkholderia sp. AU4i]
MIHAGTRSCPQCLFWLKHYLIVYGQYASIPPELKETSLLSIR